MMANALFILLLITALSCQLDAALTAVKTQVHHSAPTVAHTVHSVAHGVPHPYSFGAWPYGDIYGGFYGYPPSTSVKTVTHGLHPAVGTASVSHTTQGIHQPLPYGGFYGGFYPGAAFHYPLGLGYGFPGLYGGFQGFQNPGATTVSHTTQGVHHAGLGYGFGPYGAAHVPTSTSVSHTTQGLSHPSFGWNYGNVFGLH